jgi:hypothetical protein
VIPQPNRNFKSEKVEEFFIKLSSFILQANAAAGKVPQRFSGEILKIHLYE